MENNEFQDLVIKKLEEQDKFQNFVIKKLEDNDKFQELVITHFGEIQGQFGEIQGQFEKIDSRFDEVFKKLEDHDARFDRLEVLANQHHEELELVARQVENHEVKDLSKSKFYLVKAPD
ncbi:MAG TPA: hypothetical protein VIM32_01555 [Desulfosporosinus sp.]|nr:hypothetical protein [Desulfosporosinus sp.]